MKIICAGLSKTGTKSLNAALTHLGYKVYDFPDPIYLHGDTWRNMFMGKANSDDLKKILSEFDAGMDAPVNEFWEDILEAFPDAKVILTIRDDEQVWVRSFFKQVYQLYSNIFFILPQVVTPTGRKMGVVLDHVARMTYSGYPFSLKYFGMNDKNRHVDLNPRTYMQSYRRHNANVIQRCPKDKLLVYNCKEGWRPLCEFLGDAIPNVKFPHKNVRGSHMEDALKRHPLFIQIAKEFLFVNLIFLILCCICAYLILKYFF